MEIPHPPNTFNLEQKTLFYSSYYAQDYESFKEEVTVRAKTAAICLALTVLVTFGMCIGIWGASTEHLSSLALTSTITGTVVFTIAGSTLTTFVGIRLDARAYQLNTERGILADRVILQISSHQQE